MSEMKFEDTRGYGGSPGNSNTFDSGSVLDNGKALSHGNAMEQMARTAVRGDIVQPLSNQQRTGGAMAAPEQPVHTTGTGYTAATGQNTHTGTAGLSVSQQQKLLQDMETLQRRLEKEMLERKQLETELAERNRKEREHLEEEARKELESRDAREIYTTNKVAISNWFLTICYLNIPVVNVIYFLCTLISRKTPQPKKAYVVAWAVFQVLCIALAALLIYFVIQFGADFIDNMLKYIPH